MQLTTGEVIKKDEVLIKDLKAAQNRAYGDTDEWGRFQDMIEEAEKRIQFFRTFSD
jgi:hypothetical protein